MSRPPRDMSAGTFHVYSHSVWAAELFRDDRDRMAFLRELLEARVGVRHPLERHCEGDDAAAVGRGGQVGGVDIGGFGVRVSARLLHRMLR